ncbi:MAG: TIGR03617 family F420-dependent LLM class oxidoreductase, partial [Actinomycetota bacterium]
MKIDGALSMSLPAAAEEAATFEAIGLDGAWSFEGNRDPFIPLTMAADTTSTLELGTAIAVAFARTPMTLAHTAWDLQQLTEGRFILGLGTQIKPHITKRYGMPWSAPAARMREFVQALRAIWDSWTTGERLDFRGEFYTHTLMTPFFSPPRAEVTPPPVYVAGVGPKMMRTIGEVADGFFVHPFHTPA